MEEISETTNRVIDRVAKRLAYMDTCDDHPVTLTSAIRSLTTCLRRAPTENEKRALIARYGRWLRRIEQRHRVIV